MTEANKTPIRKNPTTTQTAAKAATASNETATKSSVTVPAQIAADIAAQPEPVYHNTVSPVTQPTAKQGQDAPAFDMDASINEAKNLAREEGAERTRLATMHDASTSDAPEYMFLSRMPALVLYVTTDEVRMAQGVEITQEQIVEFKNGAYKTDNIKIASALRKHPRINSFFREEKNFDQMAVRQQLERQRQQLRSATKAGSTSSADGNESLFNAQDIALEREVFKSVDL